MKTTTVLTNCFDRMMRVIRVDCMECPAFKKCSERVNFHGGYNGWVPNTKRGCKRFLRSWVQGKK